MKVIKSNVLIELIEAKSESGTIIEVNKKPERFGIIVELGEELIDHKTLQVGKKVRYREHFDGEEFQENSKSFIVMNYDGILIVY